MEGDRPRRLLDRDEGEEPVVRVREQARRRLEASPAEQARGTFGILDELGQGPRSRGPIPGPPDGLIARGNAGQEVARGVPGPAFAPSFGDLPFDQGRIGPVAGLRQHGQADHLPFANLDTRQAIGPGHLREALLAAVRDVARSERPRTPAFAPGDGRLGDLESVLRIGDRGLVQAGESAMLRRGEQGHVVAGDPVLLAAGGGISRAVEDPVEGVIVVRANRVVLVVVAPGAGDRQAEDSLAEGVDGIVDGEGMILRDVEAEPAGDGEVARGRDELGMASGRGVGGEFLREQVAGDLLAEELVVRHVGVEGVDDVVPKTPGVGHGEVGRLPGGVGVMGHVEPGPAPLLSIMRRGE